MKSQLYCIKTTIFPRNALYEFSLHLNMIKIRTTFNMNNKYIRLKQPYVRKRFSREAYEVKYIQVLIMIIMCFLPTFYKHTVFDHIG